MALFVDGPACTIDDLTDQDAGLLDIAQTTSINVTTKLRLAWEEIGTDLHLWLVKPKPAAEVVWGLAPRIEQVVITPVLKRWEAMHALTLFYRDAYFSALVDRYQARWQEYKRLTRDVRDSFLASGLPLVSDPVIRAAAPALGTIPGPQSGGMFYASVTWVNSAGQEGAASPASSITVEDGNLMTVGTVSVPRNAMGFNVYAGTSVSALYRQNDVVLPPELTYMYIPGQVTAGALALAGQKPEYTLPLARTWLRG